MKRMTILSAAIILVAILGVMIWRLNDHDLSRRASQPFELSIAGDRVSGTIWLPDATPSAAIAIVHGDGAQDRTSFGGYAPLINTLLDDGFAVASWDKPGVGKSGGNWLLQTMPDRAAETRGVLDLLSQKFKGVSVGALGFSQAGWVVPLLTPADADFLILVGAAVSWKDQGVYYTRVRLHQEGLDEQQIQAALAEQTIEDEGAFGAGATSLDRPAGMSVDRWQFVKQNRQANSQQDLATLKVPLLALWGEEDLNVDPVRNSRIFRERLGDVDPSNQIVVVPNATHGLLRASTYNWQLTEDWSRWAAARFLLEGRYSYAPDALNTIRTWIHGVASNR